MFILKALQRCCIFSDKKPDDLRFGLDDFGFSTAEDLALGMMIVHLGDLSRTLLKR